jgi:hypothetical protein
MSTDNPKNGRSFFHSESHLKRASSLLSKQTLEDLLYAALEFRYAVEARLIEYSEIAEGFIKNRSGMWKVKDIARHVDSVFSIEKAVYSIEISSEKHLPNPIEIKYVPVPKEILKIVGRTDNFLHAKGASSLQMDEKRVQLRELLEEGVTLFTECISGGLYSPLIMDGDGFVKMVIDTEAHPELKRLLALGEPINMRVEVTPFIGSDDQETPDHN